MTIMLATNKIKLNIQTIIDIIILKFKKKITLINKKFVQNIVFKLIYLKNAKFVYCKGAKKIYTFYI